MSSRQSGNQPRGIEKCLKKCTNENAKQVCYCALLNRKHLAVKGSCVDGICSYCAKFGSSCYEAGEYASIPCCGENSGPQDITSIGCNNYYKGAKTKFCSRKCGDPDKYRCYGIVLQHIRIDCNISAGIILNVLFAFVDILFLDSDRVSFNIGYASCTGKDPNTYTMCPKTNQSNQLKTCGITGANCSNARDCCFGYRNCVSGKCKRTCVLKGENCKGSSCCTNFGDNKDSQKKLYCVENSFGKSTCEYVNHVNSK